MWFYGVTLALLVMLMFLVQQLQWLSANIICIVSLVLIQLLLPSFSSLGFAGTILLKSKEHLEFAKEQGPLELLRAIGWEWTQVGSTSAQD